MNIKISENTKIWTGRAKGGNAVAATTWNNSGWWVVDFVVYNNIGRIIHSMTRTPDGHNLEPEIKHRLWICFG